MEYKRLDTAGYEELMQKYHVGSLLAKVVSSFRYSEKEQDSFFHARRYERLEHDSFRQLALLLKQAKDNGDKVFVYGDYDCDGICATAIMVTVLNKLGIENGYYIPNRFTEGYGLNLERVQQAFNKGYRVIVTVDNGVSAHEALKWAHENGMITAVTDHHLIEDEVECDVLCHPSLLPWDYQFMCGAGMAYLIADYMNLADDKLKILAMIATLGDVMELKGYNVQLVQEGLQLLNKLKPVSITLLLKEAQPWDENSISYSVVPRLNSVGRMADEANPNQVVRYLLSNNAHDISGLASQIERLNDRRRMLTRQQYDSVRQEVGEDGFVILCVSKLHEGVIGSMASRLADEIKRPCIIFTEAGELLKGSGRSIPGVNIMELLEGFRGHTVNLGGHAQACGMTIEADELENLRQYVNDNYVPVQPQKEYLEITAADLTRENLEELFAYHPFGQGRRLPLMHMQKAAYDDYRSLKNDHQLKWSLTPDVSVLSFSDNHGYDHYLGCEGIEFYGELRENIFRGLRSYSFFAEEVNNCEKQ